MKILIASFLVTLSLGTFASEKDPVNPCARYQNKQLALEQELSILQQEASKLDAEGNYYPSSAADEHCEEVADEATYVSVRITNVRKQIIENRRLVKEYCNAGKVYPE